MARTFRRKQEWHEYRWVRRDWKADLPRGAWIDLDPHSNAGRKAIARFHSDKVATMLGAAPRRYRKVAWATRRRLRLDDHARAPRGGYPGRSSPEHPLKETPCFRWPGRISAASERVTRSAPGSQFRPIRSRSCLKRFWCVKVRRSVAPPRIWLLLRRRPLALDCRISSVTGSTRSTNAEFWSMASCACAAPIAATTSSWRSVAIDAGSAPRAGRGACRRAGGA